MSLTNAMPDARMEDWLPTFIAVVALIILLIGVLANTFTIVALTIAPRLRNVTSWFIISLSVSDLITCLIDLLTVILYLSDFMWMNSGFLCTVVPYILYSNWIVSFLSLFMIAFNRYFKTCHDSLYDRIYMPLKVTAMIVFCWLFSYSLHVPTIVGVGGQFRYSSVLGTCSIIPDSEGRFSEDWITIICIYIPCLIIVGFYIRILFAIRMAARGTSKCENQIYAQSEAERKREELDITKMAFIIFVTFLVCFVPSIIIQNVVIAFNNTGLYMFGIFLARLTVIIYPFIYGIVNLQYREAYVNLFKSITASCRRSDSQSALLNQQQSSSTLVGMEAL